jgi:histidine triad (HIT) family protein
VTISRNPINNYHVLIIPKVHYENFIDLPDCIAAHIFLVAKKLSEAIRKACSPVAISHLSDDDISNSGYNLISHYKFHIIPRFNDDKVKIDWGREEDKGVEHREMIANENRGYL